MPTPRRRHAAAAAWIAALAAAGMPIIPGAAEVATDSTLELGRRVFTKIAQPPCGLCHALADAGTNGEIGAKLDEIKPDEQRVLAAVRQGVGVMPRYDDKLTKEQIEAVAYYVARAVRK